MIETRKFNGGIIGSIIFSPLAIFQNKSDDEKRNMIKYNLELLEKELLKKFDLIGWRRWMRVRDR